MYDLTNDTPLSPLGPVAPAGPVAPWEPDTQIGSVSLYPPFV